MDISAITPPSTSNMGAQASNSGISLNDFYKLLAAEVQYQDPTGGGGSGGGSNSESYLTELATLSAAKAVENMTAVENYSMASSIVGKNVAYLTTSTSVTGKVTASLQTGTVDAVDFTSDEMLCYIETTANGKTSGKWVGFSNISDIYSPSVTGISTTSPSKDAGKT